MRARAWTGEVDDSTATPVRPTDYDTTDSSNVPMLADEVEENEGADADGDPAADEAQAEEVPRTHQVPPPVSAAER